MKSFIKKHKTLFIAGGAVALLATVIVAGYSASRPTPSPATGAAGVIADAAAADDWAALPVDAAGQPIGEPSPALDKKGEAIIPAGQAEEKRSADEPLPVVKAAAAGGTVLDTTADTASLLGLLLSSQTPTIKLGHDACLLKWAEATLPTVVGTSFSGVMDVCGRDAAVMYGGYSTSVRDLNLHAQYAPDKNERTALSKVLYKNDRLGYASIATDDGRAVLLVVAKANSDTSKVNTSDPVMTDEPIDPKESSAQPTP